MPPVLFRCTAACLVRVITYLVLITRPVSALSDIPRICDKAAKVAALETDVPESVLLAITRTETGRSKNGILEPWPWALNVEGKGIWLASSSEALDHAKSLLHQGIKNFDVGCFQINFRWHGAQFSSIEEMFDPTENARYAAQFLSELFETTGDWSKAAGTYHSRTTKYAARYISRFDKIHAELETQPIVKSPAAASLANNFPLLKRSSIQPHLGSLVPLGNTSGKGLLSRLNGKS